MNLLKTVGSAHAHVCPFAHLSICPIDSLTYYQPRYFFSLIKAEPNTHTHRMRANSIKSATLSLDNQTIGKWEIKFK